MAVQERALLPPRTTGPEGWEYDSDMAVSERRKRLLAAFVVLSVLVVSLIALLLSRDEPQEAATPRTVSTPSAEAVPAPLTTAPAGVTWEDFQGVSLPTSRTDGPSRIDGPVHAGYSRTPTGALLAAAQIRVRALATPGVPDLLRVVDEQFAPGPGKAAYRELISTVTDTSPPTGGYTQYVGFRYLSYTPDLAVISLAARGGSGVLRASTATVRWLDGDWRLEKAADGQEPGQVLQDTAGYVPWSGVS